MSHFKPPCSPAGLPPCRAQVWKEGVPVPCVTHAHTSMCERGGHSQSAPQPPRGTRRVIAVFVSCQAESEAELRAYLHRFLRTPLLHAVTKDPSRPLKCSLKEPIRNRMGINLSRNTHDFSDSLPAFYMISCTRPNLRAAFSRKHLFVSFCAASAWIRRGPLYNGGTSKSIQSALSLLLLFSTRGEANNVLFASPDRTSAIPTPVVCLVWCVREGSHGRPCRMNCRNHKGTVPPSLVESCPTPDPCGAPLLGRRRGASWQRFCIGSKVRPRWRSTPAPYT